MYDERNGLGISDWDAPVYRIFEKKWLLEMLQTGKNGLVPTHRWDDPFENFFLKCTSRTPEGDVVHFDQLHKSWFGQCWTLQAESDAMWRIYSKDYTGVRVATTIRKLFTSFYNDADHFATLKFVIGAIQYKDRAAIEEFLRTTSLLDLTFGGQIHGLAQTLCIKRREFSHEHEVRLLFHDSEKAYQGQPVVLFPFEHTIIDNLLLHPRLDPVECKTLKEELAAAGYNGTIEQSQLYTFTPPSVMLQ